MPIEDEAGELIESPLSQILTRNAITVDVQIYGDGEGKWILEAVDEQNTSHVWDHRFETDQEALEEAIRALEEEPTEFFVPPPGSAH